MTKYTDKLSEIWNDIKMDSDFVCIAITSIPDTTEKIYLYSDGKKTIQVNVSQKQKTVIGIQFI